jgi:hypothetical protein
MEKINYRAISLVNMDAKILNTMTTNPGKDMGKNEHLSTVGRNCVSLATMEINMEGLKKLKIQLYPCHIMIGHISKGLQVST